MKIIPFLLLIFFAFENTFSQNQNISNGTDFDGEPYIAIDPLNPNHIVVAWMSLNGFYLVQIATRVSFDAGNSWENIVLIPHVTEGFTSADPSLCFDAEGKIVVCYIDYDLTGSAGGVYIRKSDDGGLTWNDPVEAIDLFADGSEMPVDRPWMVIDRSGGLYNGTIYITTKPAPWIPFPNRNYLVVSTNGGASFNEWNYIDTVGWSVGPFIQAPMASPAVSSDGTFHCVYPAFDPTENILPRFIHVSSTDAANNLSYSEMIESFGDELVSDTLPKLGYLLISDPADVNHLVFNFIIRPYGDPDIFILESFNGGISWNDMIRVNDDPQNTGVMQDMVWADINQNGDLAVCWRDRRNAVDTGYAASSEFWFAVKRKDSVSFAPNLKLSDELVPFNDILKENGNDFMGCEFSGDTIFAVWGEVREETLNIWFTKVSATTGGGTSIKNINSINAQLFLSPNPTTGMIYLLQNDITSLSIIDASGKRILEILNPGQSVDLGILPDGLYSAIAKTGTLILEQQFIKQ